MLAGPVAGASGFINNRDLSVAGPFIATSNRVVRLPARELGLLSEFCTPMVVLVSATSFYYYCHVSFVITATNVIFGVAQILVMLG